MSKLVIIERNIGGGFVVSVASKYEVEYYAEYTSMRFGVNIFGQKLDSIFPRELSKMRYTQTKIKAGVALSGSFKNESDAMAWAKKQGLEVFSGPLHTAI